MSNITERKKKWLASDKALVSDGLQCAHKNCNSSTLAIMDGPDDPGVICFEHFVNGKPCINENCDRPQVEKGLCRQCLNGDEIPPQFRFYRESMLAQCPNYLDTDSDDDVNSKTTQRKLNKLLTKAIRKNGIGLKKFNPFNAYQV